MTISAEYNQNDEKKDECGKYIYRERRFGSMKRSFNVSDGINEDGITAEFKDGVLTLNLPKVEEAKHETHTIAIL